MPVGPTGSEPDWHLDARSTSSHVVAAVHVQNVTRNVGSHWRCQKQNRVHNFVNVTEAVEWNLFNEILCYLIRHLLAHADVNETGCDRVNSDLISGELARGHFRQCDDSGFARRIIGLAEESHLAADRREIDNATAVAQDRGGLLSDSERTGQVYTYDVFEFLQRHLLYRPVANDS